MLNKSFNEIYSESDYIVAIDFYESYKDVLKDWDCDVIKIKKQYGYDLKQRRVTFSPFSVPDISGKRYDKNEFQEFLRRKEDVVINFFKLSLPDLTKQEYNIIRKGVKNAYKPFLNSYSLKTKTYNRDKIPTLMDVCYHIYCVQANEFNKGYDFEYDFCDIFISYICNFFGNCFSEKESLKLNKKVTVFDFSEIITDLAIRLKSGDLSNKNSDEKEFLLLYVQSIVRTMLFAQDFNIEDNAKVVSVIFECSPEKLKEYGDMQLPVKKVNDGEIFNYYNLNTNVIARDIMIFGSYEYNKGVRYFNSLSVDILEDLVELNLIDLKDYANFSPTNGEFFEFMKKQEGFYASGHVVSLTRWDYRITIDGIWKEGVISETLREEFVKTFAKADVLKNEANLLSCWYD